MKSRGYRHFVVAAIVGMPSVSHGQADTGARRPVVSDSSARRGATTVGPPVRRVSTASALSTEEIGAITSVVELKDGRVLVNDGTRRRLLLMDTTLKTVEVVLDSLAEIANSYGTRPGTLIPYRGDSVVFVDPASYAALVLDPEGRIARVRSAWRPNDDMFYYTNPGGTSGFPATDGRGRVVYRISARPEPPKVAPPAGVPYIPSPPDSAYVVSIDLDTRAMDTLGVVKIPKIVYQIHQSAEGYLSISVMTNPMPTTDDWAVLPNGDVAFVRGRDYRVEYRHPDGTWTSSAKLPFDWRRLNDDDKQKFVDSLKNTNRRQQMSNYLAAMIRWVNMYDKPYPKDLTVPAGFVPQNGLAKTWKLPPGVTFPANYIYACAPGEEAKMLPLLPGQAPAAPATPSAPLPFGAIPGGVNAPSGPAGTPSCIPTPIVVSGGIAPPPPTIRELSIVPPDELPDYQPPFVAGAVRADADGNLWVRTIPPKPVPGGLVYDVIGPTGNLADRLQLPPGYTLVGFGKGKVVYLSMRDLRGIHLARVRLR